MVSFTTFLVRSLELLREQSPSGYRAVCERLGGRRVAIVVDGEAVSVTNEEGRLLVSSGAKGAVARASASKQTLVSLLTAERDLTDAILADEVILVGALDDLVAFNEGLSAYFMGAVRVPEFAPLLDEFFGAMSVARDEQPSRQAAEAWT